MVMKRTQAAAAGVAPHEVEGDSRHHQPDAEERQRCGVARVLADEARGKWDEGQGQQEQDVQPQQGRVDLVDAVLAGLRRGA